jgi:hypothetical protein
MNKRTFIKLCSAAMTSHVLQPIFALAAGDKLKNWAGNVEYGTEQVYSARSLEDVRTFGLVSTWVSIEINSKNGWTALWNGRPPRTDARRPSLGRPLTGNPLERIRLKPPGPREMRQVLTGPSKR